MTKRNHCDHMLIWYQSKIDNNPGMPFDEMTAILELIMEYLIASADRS
jgi:hypothetical protein